MNNGARRRMHAALRCTMQGFGVQGVGSPGDLVSKVLGVQGVGMVITSRRDARKLVID